MKPFHSLRASAVVAVLSLLPAVAATQNEVFFRLESANALAGTEVRLPFFIESDGEVRAFCTVINFDETLLEVTEIEPVYVVPEEFNQTSVYPRFEGTNNWGFYFAAFDNRNENEGDGTDEGVIKASGVFSFVDYVALPVSQPNEVLAFHFRVHPDAPIGETQVRFEDFLEMPNTSPKTRNVVTVGAVGGDVDVLFPPLDTVPVAINASLAVVGDVSLFVRGNANGDDTLDISDVLTTLSFLFLGEDSVACLDAADSNDDGAVDVSDPLTTLNFLFLGGAPLPPPAEAPGLDPTPDDLGCR